jgi:putative ABC transport system permease protein
MLKLEDAFSYAIHNLQVNKLRTLLTVLGIIIGVTTIISIMSIGEGLKKDITSQLESFGSDRMFIIPINLEGKGFGSAGGSPTSGKLFEKDVDRILKVPGVMSTSKLVYGKATVEFKDKSINTLVYATTANLYEQWADLYPIETGRTFKDSESGVVILGNDAANVIFGKKQVGIGNVMTINGKTYRVVGILKRQGTSLSQADDSAIYVPFDDGTTLFSKQLAKDEINFISIKVDPGYDPEQIKNNIEFELASLHRVTLDNKDFTVVTADFVNKTIGSVLDMLTLFLFLITLISGVVGGIGIANTMFMSVVERTKEVGILKSVGGSRRDILTLFLVESGLLGLVGGLIGLVVAYLLLNLAASFGLPYVLKPEFIFYTILFSFIVGVAAGLFPARQAADMDAVEALNFE